MTYYKNEFYENELYENEFCEIVRKFYEIYFFI